MKIQSWNGYKCNLSIQNEKRKKNKDDSNIKRENVFRNIVHTSKTA